jgi:hypothetical protein
MRRVEITLDLPPTLSSGEDLYLDQPPDLAMELRSQMRIPDDYFAAIAEDLTDQQAGDRVAQLRKVCAGVVGP